MIVMGHSLCLPSPATVQELFSVARDASIIPDISLDPVLTSFLSLDSSAALQHHYRFLQRSMSREQQTLFNLNLTQELGGSRVTYGGVGIVALALFLLFDQVSQQVQAQGLSVTEQSTDKSEAKAIFGISTSSRIGQIIDSYLRIVPGIANYEEKMAETTELFDNWLKLELIDHFERMTTKKRMSSLSMQQWLTGAAIHLHIRIHQVRLHSVPWGSAASLRLSYKTALNRLIQDYTAYLRRNTQETAPSNPQQLQTRSSAQTRHTNTSNTTNATCLGQNLFNNSRANVSFLRASSNEMTTTSSDVDIRRKCKTQGFERMFDVTKAKGSNRRNTSIESREKLTNLTMFNRDKGAHLLGLLVIEPWRNVSHNVQHHPCESPAIQEALVTRIMSAQDLQRNRNIFRAPDRVFHRLLRQRGDFELKTN